MTNIEDYIKTLSDKEKERILIAIMEWQQELGPDADIKFHDFDGEVSLYWDSSGDYL